MNAYLDKPFSIGYAWDDGPTYHFSTQEEAMDMAERWRLEDKDSSPIYVFQLLEIK